MALSGAALLLLATAALFLRYGAEAAASSKVCVVGSGIGGSSVAHFLKHYTCAKSAEVPCMDDIRILERSRRVGGRMATVTIGGDTFEAGASIIHPKNRHALGFARLLNLNTKTEDDSDYDPKSNVSSSSSWFGIWDGSRFVFQTLPPPSSSSSALYRKMYPLLNSLVIFWRYGISLIRMNRFVKEMVEKFLLYYTNLETRPVFETVEEMLKWSGLYGLTRRTLHEELVDAGMSSRLISELVTVITRINYGQDVSISGLAGTVSLAGSDSGLWSVDGGNWQLAAGLIGHTNATLHLHEEIDSISYTGGYYELNSTKGNSYTCEVTVIATPLDELNITFIPPVSVPSRRLQHTFTTFVRGLLNPKYFGLNSASEIPDLVGTLELPDIPFSCVSVLKKYNEEDMTYKMFSRAPLDDSLLDSIFSKRKETIRIDWAAYPHYEAPEVFAPIVLDGAHLYYINSFENAASTIETSAVAAENVARLIISRVSALSSDASIVMPPISAEEVLHTDL
ncbi:farnesylcysteine lyase [Canna indica]|uniref:Farnesylcysteine lyase n=1 Tax=Canna indica TaxID=4628 RepID=A0AAQ3KZV1_9LILI|nr:farnesylcysteine lyase [Canna indica]